MPIFLLPLVCGGGRSCSTLRASVVHPTAVIEFNPTTVLGFRVQGSTRYAQGRLKVVEKWASGGCKVGLGPL